MESHNNMSHLECGFLNHQTSFENPTPQYLENPRLDTNTNISYAIYSELNTFRHITWTYTRKNGALPMAPLLHR